MGEVRRYRGFSQATLFYRCIYIENIPQFIDAIEQGGGAAREARRLSKWPKTHQDHQPSIPSAFK
jgi:hypothetical protein